LTKEEKEINYFKKIYDGRVQAEIESIEVSEDEKNG